MSKSLINKLLDNWGSGALCILGALAVLEFNNISQSLTAEIAFEILLIRVLYTILFAPGNHVTAAFTQKSIFDIVKFEMRISVAFLAACYLMNWPIQIGTVIQLISLNYLLQLLWGLSAHQIRQKLTSKQAISGRLKSSKQALIIGSGHQAKTAADLILNNFSLDSRIIGFLDNKRDGLWSYRDIPLVGRPEELEKIISNNHIDYVILAVEPEELLSGMRLTAAAEKMGISVLVMTEFYQPTLSRVFSTNSGNQIIAEYSTAKQINSSRLFKSILDRIGALIGIIVTSPILIVTAILIKINSKGPVLFKQIRSGQNGRKFTLWKFRTMVVDAEQIKESLKNLNEMSGPVFKIARDPRVTRIGGFLRKYSIDELPQLFNVLRGDMSLVGPRPPLPNEVANFKPWQHRKLSVKPGLTCLWQTNGRNNVDFEEWMKLDLKYIDNWSLWEDAKIIARTVPTVLKGTGT